TRRRSPRASAGGRPASAAGCCAGPRPGRSRRPWMGSSRSVADAPVPEMRWWGWGEDAHAGGLPPHARAFLDEHVGTAQAPRAPVALEQVAVEPSALAEHARGELAGSVGAENVREDHAERVRHAAGKGYPDLVRLRAGTPEGAPDAVVLPHGSEQLAELLALCSSASLAVVPFGGGTSVVGGVEPLRGDHAGVIALD